MMLAALTLVVSASTAPGADPALSTINPQSFFSAHEILPITVAGSHRTELLFTVPTTRDLGHGSGSMFMRTSPSKVPFAEGFTATHTLPNGTTLELDIDPDRFHTGVLLSGEGGEPMAGSHVQLHIAPNGALSAVVRTPTGQQVHIESGSGYGHPAVTDDTIDTIVDSRRSRRGLDEALHHLVYRATDLLPERVEEIGRFCGAADPPARSDTDRRRNVDNVWDTPLSSYSESSVGGAARYRRGSVVDCRNQNSGTGGKCDCTMALVADASFLNSDNVQGNSPTVAAQVMINLVLSADQIYRNTQFGSYTGIGLAIGRVAIDQSSTLNSGTLTDPNAVLQTFTSTQDWSSMCAAHLFTHRNFYGTLGLAYIGTLCTKENTGFHSSYGVPQVIQLITLSHELGHNFGSNHDTSSACTPGDSGDSGGNYLMYPAATNGNLRNNLLFSNCSRSDISYVINKKSGCFSMSTPHCGNGIVEPGEDCDCGLSCTSTSCCTSSCTVNTNAGYTCSPQNPLLYPCCTPEDGSASQCQIVSASANRVCNDETSCAAASKCNGVSAACPVGTPKQSWVTECGCINDDCATYPHTGDRVCMRGACNVSRCRIFGAWPCEAPHAPCALSCKGSGWGNGSECVSTFNTTARHVNQTWGVHYSAGQVCDGMKGYCTSSGTCQRVGADMERSFFSATHSYIQAYWWAILLTIVAFVGLQVVVMRLHRMKRRRGYESLDDGGSGRWLAPDNAKRDGFEMVLHADGYDTADDDSDSDADGDGDGHDTDSPINTTAKSSSSEKSATVRHDFYERERRAVIFRAYKREFAEAANEAELEAHGLRLKEVIESGNLDQKNVMELRKGYVKRLNQLRGFPDTPESTLSTSFDSACAAVDSTRRAASRVWHKTKTKVVATAKDVEREIDRQDYVYY